MTNKPSKFLLFQLFIFIGFQISPSYGTAVFDTPDGYAPLGGAVNVKIENNIDIRSGDCPGGDLPGAMGNSEGWTNPPISAKDCAQRNTATEKGCNNITGCSSFSFNPNGLRPKVGRCAFKNITAPCSNPQQGRLALGDETYYQFYLKKPGNTCQDTSKSIDISRDTVMSSNGCITFRTDSNNKFILVHKNEDITSAKTGVGCFLTDDHPQITCIIKDGNTYQCLNSLGDIYRSWNDCNNAGVTMQLKGSDARLAALRKAVDNKNGFIAGDILPQISSAPTPPQGALIDATKFKLADAILKYDGVIVATPNDESFNKETKYYRTVINNVINYFAYSPTLTNNSCYVRVFNNAPAKINANIANISYGVVQDDVSNWSAIISDTSSQDPKVKVCNQFKSVVDAFNKADKEFKANKDPKLNGNLQNARNAAINNLTKFMGGQPW